MNLPKISTDRGQVGIGTLIVFIAMVLVASIAAGVLLNTGGLVSDTAEETGAESQEQVSERLYITSAVGEVNDAEDGVKRINFTVRKAPGSSEIDMSELFIEYHTKTDYGTINETQIQGDEGMLDDQSRRYLIVTFNETVIHNGQKATFTFNTKAGASSIYRVSIPEVLGGKTYLYL